MIYNSNGEQIKSIGQFGINKNLMDRIIREAKEDDDEEDFDIDSAQFDDPEDEKDDSDNKTEKDNAIENILSDDSPDKSEESNTDAKSQAVADALSDDETSETDSGEETQSNEDTSSETSSEDSTGEDDDFSMDGMDDSDASEDGDDDFSINTDDSEDGTSDEGSEEDSETSGDGTDTSSNINDELINKEKDLLSGLTDKQIEIKTNELRNTFDDLLESINQTSTKLSNISADQKTMSIVKYLITQLDKLNTVVNDYLTATFATKTYTENTVYYQTCLSQINTVRQVLEIISSKTENKAKQKGKK